jgi:catechol 2,3-dioxygenase-like lactoylglutathione lyase family enzyme
MAKIRHIAIWTDNPDELSKFYVDTFGLKITQPLRSSPESGSWVFLTDGYIHLALISPGKRQGKPNGINHFGFTVSVDERQAILAKLKEHDIAVRQCPPDNPYVEDRVHDIHGNPIDISTTDLRPQPN